MFRTLYNWTLAWAGSRYATAALAVISFVESSVFPIPADVLFIPMCLSKPNRAMRYALIATVTSVLGGMFGWAIGHYAFEMIAKPILEFYGKLDAFNAMKSATGESAILVMLVTAGASHIPPMKVVTILAGVIGFNFKLFVLSAIVARGARFYALAWLLQHHGEKMVDFIERRFAWLGLGLAPVLGLAYIAVRSL